MPWDLGIALTTRFEFLKPFTLLLVSNLPVLFLTCCLCVSLCFGEAEIVWWNARETLWARSSSRCDRLMRTCSRSSGRSKVRIAAVLSIRSDIFTDVPDSATRL
jgi:hypothetical protein